MIGGAGAVSTGADMLRAFIPELSLQGTSDEMLLQGAFDEDDSCADCLSKCGENDNGCILACNAGPAPACPGSLTWGDDDEDKQTELIEETTTSDDGNP